MPDFVEVSVFTRNGAERLIAKVSPEDADRVLAYRWIASRERHTIYATMGSQDRSQTKLRQTPHIHRSMHRFILNAHPGEAVDHINTDGLDNRRCNIRKCTASENIAARAARSFCGYKGVAFKRFGWVASLTENRTKRVIGVFDTAEEAARAFDRRAILKFGDMAWLNFTDKVQAPRIVPINHSYIQTCNAALAKHRRERPPAFCSEKLPPYEAVIGTRAWALLKAGIRPTPDGL